MQNPMSAHPSRWISLRRADWCEGCGSALPDGARAQWDPILRTVTCAACAGRRPLAPAIVLELVEELPPPAASPEPRLGEWALGPGTDAAVRASLRRRLADGGVRLLGDRRIPGSHGRIDQLAIGPGGVTVIAVSRLEGEVRLERRGSLLRPRARQLTPAGRELAARVEGQLRAVRALLRANGHGGIHLAGAVCAAGTDRLALFGQVKVDGVLVDGPRGVARLAGREGSLDDAGVERVLLTLAARLRD
jgi:hypothetical protein